MRMAKARSVAQLCTEPRMPARRASLLVVLALLLACGPSGLAAPKAAPSEDSAAWAAQGGGWVTLAPLGEPRQEIGVAAIEGAVYALAGFRGDGTPSPTAEAYH